jgi:hypothetical protein
MPVAAVAEAVPQVVCFGPGLTLPLATAGGGFGRFVRQGFVPPLPRTGLFFFQPCTQKAP